MDKIVESLKKLLPEAEVTEVASVVKEMLEQAKAGLEKEYNEKLEEAYAELSNELAQAEKVAEASYQDAHNIIGELRHRLDLVGEEYKAALDESHEEFYQKLKTAEDKNSTLEVEMYEEYDRKLSEMKDYIVDKVAQFLELKTDELTEQARREVLSDPSMAEHKVALDKIVEVTAKYLTNEDINGVTSSKLNETQRQMEEMKGQLRIMEARNIRLSTENTKLNETVRQASEVINEQKKAVVANKKETVINEQKERANKAKNVTGRGHTEDNGAIIAEYAAPVENNDMNDLLVLSGVKKTL